MPMDAYYDMGHTCHPDKTLDIYSYSNVDQCIKDFIESCNLEASTSNHFQKRENKELETKIREIITKFRAAFHVLDSRIISNMGGRVCHYITPPKTKDDVFPKPKSYLIVVWRGYYSEDT